VSKDHKDRKVIKVWLARKGRKAKQCCSALLRPSASCRCPVMPMSAASEASDYVLLHRDTCSALYTTRATEEEIARANSSLSRAGQRSRFVTATRYLMQHHNPGQQS
jgi:hypothetical protein